MPEIKCLEIQCNLALLIFILIFRLAQNGDSVNFSVPVIRVQVTSRPCFSAPQESRSSSVSRPEVSPLLCKLAMGINGLQAGPGNLLPRPSTTSCLPKSQLSSKAHFKSYQSRRGLPSSRGDFPSLCGSHSFSSLGLDHHLFCLLNLSHLFFEVSHLFAFSQSPSSTSVISAEKDHT